MFTTRITGEMKIFAADVAESSATGTAACNTPVQQQQQLEFRSRMSNGSPGSKTGQCHLKFGKYNNKTANLLRQVNICHSSSSGGSSSNNNEANKGQQQLQQLHYCNNSHSWARKKYFGNVSNSSNNLQQQQPQQQSAYYQRQQQQQLQHQIQQQQDQQSLNNNNNVLMKNQNSIQPLMSECKSSDSNNNCSTTNNRMSAKPVKWLSDNNNSSSSSNMNTNSNTISTKKRNSSTADVNAGYYRKVAESGNSAESAAEMRETDAAAATTTDACHNRSPPTTGTAGRETSLGKTQDLEQDQTNQTNQPKQRPRQQPLSFWKTNYPQPTASQLKDKETVAAVVSAAAAAASEQQQQSLSFEHRRNSGYQQQHQQHNNYYQYYYSQPKQLTIASFLQKELLPDSSGEKASCSSNSSNNNSNLISASSSNSNNYSRQQYGHQSVGSGYQQRYRNAQNVYQQYQQQHHQAQQQHSHQQFRRKHGDNSSNHSSGINQKKMHYSPTGKNGDPVERSSRDPGQQHHQQHLHQQQKTIEILASSNFSAMHRRMQGGNNNKNGYYQHNNYHPLTGESGTTPTRSEHQNIYNLTYVHVDMEASAAAGDAGGAAPVVKPSLLGVKPSISITPASSSSAATTPTTVVAPPPAHPPATTGHVRNMFAPPPLAMIGVSPVSTPTPTKMISCAQLDEAITSAAAASGDQSLATSPSYNQAGSGAFITIPPQQQQASHLIPTSQPPPPPPLPQMFHFHFADGFCNPGPPVPPHPPVWPHSSSPCYPANSYGNGSGPGTSPHNKDVNTTVGLRPVSPALSSSSLGSESHWSSRLSHGGHLSISPTPSAQLSPHPLHQQHPPPLSNHHGHPHGQMNGHAMSSYIPHRPPPPPPPPHPHPPISSPTPGATAAPWYELLLPPDRYLAQARNVEVAVQPEKLICMCKYDSLSAEIWKRFRGAQQTHKKFKVKMRLWRYLFLWMNQPMFERYRICLVGSTITGFGTDSSDIDMCLLPEQGAHPHQQQQHYHQQHHHFHNEKRTEALIILTLFNAVLKDTEVFQDFNLIEARVPILRFKDITNGIEVDLNFNNSVGIKNTYLLQLYAQLDWRTRPLVVIVKLWAQYHDINDAKRMTISSYSLVLMVLHYLQHACVPHVLPCLHTLYPEKFQLGQQDCLDLDLIEPIEPYQALNNQTLGEHLLGFFKYYSSFDFRNFAISIRTGGVLPVATCRMAKSPKNDVYQWKELNIEEPFDLSNTARSVYDYATFERVKGVFLASARRLDHTLDLATVFRPIHHVPPESFSQQQQQLLYPNPGQQRSAGGGGAAPMSSKLIPDAATTFAEATAANVA
ncbi:hypothetical protein KR084_001668 [Drosophila pseudotakahashii]|nr:hypothetical protein KR084_001668 [Drosophila pseudotakahashii]